MSDAAVYFDSLKDKTNTIRLLKASISKKVGNKTFVTWSLEVYKLDSAPKYTALSYVWGPETYSNRIRVNRRTLHVLDSVNPILEAIENNSLFSSHKESWWWIDSICINQNDLDECKSQMPMMGDIYKRAYRTIGWVGIGSGVSGQAEDSQFVKRGERAIKHLRYLKEHRNEIVDGVEEDRQASMKKAHKYVDWKAVEEFLLRPWWTRVWTLQEYLLAPKFAFWCGDEQISKSELKVAIYAISKIRKETKYLPLISQDAWLPVWNRRRLFMWYIEQTDKLPLIALLAYNSDCRAKVPKDRIYAVSGLAKRDVDKQLVSKLAKGDSEEKNTAQIYQDFASEHIRKHKTLDIICFAHVFNQKTKCSTLVGKLPSWVPDWTAEIPSFVMPVMASQNPLIGNFRSVKEKDDIDNFKAYAASGTKHHRYHKQVPDSTILSCKGVVIDTITTRDPPKNRKILSRDQATATLDDLASTLALGRKDRYLSKPYFPGCYYHDLRAFCKAIPACPKDVPDSFSHWFQQNEDLVIGDHTLRDIVHQSLRRPEFPQSSKPDDVLDKKADFLERFDDTTSTERMAKKLVTTEKCRFGMAPNRAQQGDKICVLFGCSIPLALRPRGDKFELVGECYMNDLMNGEAIVMVEDGVLEYVTIEIV